MLLISFCNQERARRAFSLAALDPTEDRIDWIRVGARRRDFGTAGRAVHDDHLYVVIQSNRAPRIVALDRGRWQIRGVSPLARVRDPHSLTVNDGALYVASTGDNAVYRLTLDGPVVGREEMHWRYPGTSETHDDVHLNALAFFDGDLIVSAFGPRDADGRWTPNGVILNADTGQRLAVGLDQPHTVVQDGNRLAFCESRTGRVHTGTRGDGHIEFQAHDVDGYTRGLWFDTDDLLVGISGHRAASRSTKRALATPNGAVVHSGLRRLRLGSSEVTSIADLSDGANEVYDVIEIDAAQPTSAVRPTTSRLADLGRRLLSVDRT